MFKCPCCGEVFCEPRAVRTKENLDGENGWWSHSEEYCPCCGSQDFFEAEEYEETA